MCIWSWIKEKMNNRSGSSFRAPSREIDDYRNVSAIEEELIERAFDLEEKRHQLDTKKELDKVQITFSRILMAAAILTLGLILLSSFEIPFVNVSPEIVKLMINAVVVEIAGIVSLGLSKHFGKNDNEKKE
jgi:hypothetical protein